MLEVTVYIWNASLTMGNISTRGHTYNHYQQALSVPLVTLYSIAMPLLVIFVTRNIWKRHSAYNDSLTELPWKSAMYDLPQLIFKLYDEKEVNGVKIIFLCGRQLLPVKNTTKKKVVVRATLASMEFLFLNSVSILVCSALLFWYIFLLKQTFTCDPGVDCFALSIEDKSPLQQRPIDNCSDFEMMNNVTIECYHYAFLFGTGLSAFGGLLKFGEISLRISISVFFWGVDAATSTVTTVTTKSKIWNILKRIVGVFIIVILALSPVTVIVTGFSFIISLVVSNIVKEVATLFKFILYLITFCFIGLYILSVALLARSLPERESQLKILVTEEAAINGSEMESNETTPLLHS